MKILAIETSCDETAAAIVSKELKNDHVKILSNVVASSIVFHSKTGGIVPEIAAREQLKFIVPVIKRAIKDSKASIKNIDAIAVTVGPGLIGSLLVGIETAKTLAYIWKKPIIPVNHLLGHIYANFIQRADDGRQKTDTRNTENTENLSSVLPVVRTQSSVFSPPIFPAIALIVSGGHTDLVLMQQHQKIKWIGGTLDDAAGEAFDKIGRLLNLSYPGGPSIEKASERGDDSRFTFPMPMIGSKDFNFSFSGLKAAVFREVLKLKKLDKQQVADISKATQKSIIEVLVKKTIKAAKKYDVKSILLGGGVAANQILQKEMHSQLSTLNFQLHVPPAHLCTDNAAMIGAYAAFNYKPALWKNITVNPQLYFN